MDTPCIATTERLNRIYLVHTDTADHKQNIATMSEREILEMVAETFSVDKDNEEKLFQLFDDVDAYDGKENQQVTLHSLGLQDWMFVKYDCVVNEAMNSRHEQIEAEAARQLGVGRPNGLDRHWEFVELFLPKDDNLAIALQECKESANVRADPELREMLYTAAMDNWVKEKRHSHERMSEIVYMQCLFSIASRVVDYKTFCHRLGFPTEPELPFPKHRWNKFRELADDVVAFSPATLMKLLAPSAEERMEARRQMRAMNP